MPTRICDLGGWTDTWFARHGRVCHLAVWPGIRARIEVRTGPPGVEVLVGGSAHPWVWVPGVDPRQTPVPLLAATLDEAAPPAARRLTLHVEADVPTGSSLGTSASTCIAVLTAVDALAGYRRPIDVQAARAHRVETTRLGWQSGVQDQFAGAPGTAHLVEVDAYPHASCRALPVAATTLDALDASLLVMALGRSHSSSAVHDAVVQALAGAGPDDPRLERLRRLAAAGADALTRGDLPAYGQCLRENTEAQRSLHAALVGAEATQLIALAREAGALGWKVNGAGGEGGTLTVLCKDAAQRTALARTLTAAVPGTTVLTMRLAR